MPAALFPAVPTSRIDEDAINAAFEELAGADDIDEAAKTTLSKRPRRSRLYRSLRSGSGRCVRGHGQADGLATAVSAQLSPGSDRLEGVCMSGPVVGPARAGAGLDEAPLEQPSFGAFDGVEYGERMLQVSQGDS